MTSNSFKILIIFLFTCEIVFCQPQKKSIKDEKNVTIKNYSVWEKAVIHLECARDSKSSEEIRRFDSELTNKFKDGVITNLEYLKQSILSTRDERYWGTAIYFINERKRYLITARHVVYDKKTAEEKIRNIDSSSFEYTILAEDSKYEIFNIIFRVPSLDEVMDKKLLHRDNYIMNLGAGPYNFRPYSFSDPDFDIAVISLDPENKEFADNLDNLGYIPVKMNQINDEASQIGAEIFCVGFPSTTSVIGQFDITKINLPWQSFVFSLPTFAFGRVSMLNSNLPFYWCDLSIFPGNSGGPIIENDKIVGIINAQPVIGEQRIPFSKTIKGKYVKELLKYHFLKEDEIKNALGRK